MNQRGVGFIEVLVTLVIIAIGFLGVAALQIRAQQAELESYQRSQALILLNDMVDRLNVNRTAAGCYAITVAANGTPHAGIGNATTYTCNAYGTAATQEVAASDLATWDSALKGAQETLSGNSVGSIVGARGCVSYDNVNDLYTVSVAYQGMNQTATPTDLCGTGQYGNEAQRRVVSKIIRIGDLD